MVEGCVGVGRGEALAGVTAIKSLTTYLLSVILARVLKNYETGHLVLQVEAESLLSSTPSVFAGILAALRLNALWSVLR